MGMGEKPKYLLLLQRLAGCHITSLTDLAVFSFLYYRKTKFSKKSTVRIIARNLRLKWDTAQRSLTRLQDLETVQQYGKYWDLVKIPTDWFKPKKNGGFAFYKITFYEGMTLAQCGIKSLQESTKLSIKGIAGALGISRDTVRKYKNSPDGKPIMVKPKPKPKPFEAWELLRPYIEMKPHEGLDESGLDATITPEQASESNKALQTRIAAQNQRMTDNQFDQEEIKKFWQWLVHVYPNKRLWDILLNLKDVFIQADGVHQQQGISKNCIHLFQTMITNRWKPCLK